MNSNHHEQHCNIEPNFIHCLYYKIKTSPSRLNERATRHRNTRFNSRLKKKKREEISSLINVNNVLDWILHYTNHEFQPSLSSQSLSSYDLFRSEFYPARKR